MPDDPHGTGSQQQNGGYFHDKSGVLEGDHGSRRDPMEHKRTQEHGGRWATRDAQGQQRDLGTAHTGIVGCFAGQNTLHLPLSKGLGMFGGFGRAVGDPTGNIFADAGHGTDADAADERRADDGGNVRAMVPNSGKIRCIFWASPIWKRSLSTWMIGNDRTHADEDRYHLDAAVQLGKAKGKSGIELQQITPHTGQKKPDKPGNPPFDHQVRAGQGSADQNTEKGQQEKTRRR